MFPFVIFIHLYFIHWLAALGGPWRASIKSVMLSNKTQPYIHWLSFYVVGHIFKPTLLMAYDGLFAAASFIPPTYWSNPVDPHASPQLNRHEWICTPVLLLMYNINQRYKSPNRKINAVVWRGVFSLTKRSFKGFLLSY